MNGQLEGHVLRFERALGHPPEKVWRALTEPGQLAAWFPFAVEGEWRAGATLRFSEPDGRIEPFTGEVLACDPPRLLEFTWEEGETLRFEVAPDGGGSRLVLLNTITDVGKGARDAAGWHTCLDLLEHALDGTPPPWASRERWSQLHPRYVEAFGPEAATIGPPS